MSFHFCSTASEQQSTVLGSDWRSGSDRRSIILNPNPIPNPSRSEPINFSFNFLLSFKSLIWTYNYPTAKAPFYLCAILYQKVSVGVLEIFGLHFLALHVGRSHLLDILFDKW